MEKNEATKLVDSGARTIFETGAQREITEDKGRCDLLPLDVIAEQMDAWFGEILENICDYRNTADPQCIRTAINIFIGRAYQGQDCTAYIELAKHYEAGAKKYSDRNWEKGLPLHSFVDSGIRHYLKWLRGDKDEPHDRAFLWNMFGLLWTAKHYPELDDYTIKESGRKDE